MVKNGYFSDLKIQIFIKKLQEFHPVNYRTRAVINQGDCIRDPP